MDNTVFQTNQTILKERWPKIWQEMTSAPVPEEVQLAIDLPEATLIINGIHITGCCNQMGEAKLQSELVPEESRTATVYGFGLGDLQRVLLERETIEELTVVIMNPGVAYQSLLHFVHADWLGDKRVELIVGHETETVQFPFAAAPGCLKLADDRAATIKDQVYLELARPFQKEQFEKRSDELDKRLEENLSYIKQDGDVAHLFGTLHGRPAVVVAGGPTALQQFEWLHQCRQDVYVVATSTALIPLQQAGINPDAVIIIDPRPRNTLAFEKADQTELKDVPLVYLPTVSSQVLDIWKGPRVAAYIHLERFVRQAKQIDRGFLFCSGTVTHAAVDLAVRMGANRIYLVGADFCFPDSKSHMDGAMQKIDVNEFQGFAHPWVLNGYGQRVWSRTNLVGYLRDLELYISHNERVQFVNLGKDGAQIAGADWMEDLEDA